MSDRMRALCTVLFACTATVAGAGAWPRETGEGFLSYGTTYEITGAYDEFVVEPRPVHTLYAEFGITDRLTAGFDGFYDEADFSADGVFFLRIPILDGAGYTDRFALGLGLGRTVDTFGTAESLTRFTGHWGRGLNRGWLSLDLSATRSGDGGQDLKADATFGIENPSKTLVILRTTAEKADGDPSKLWLAPSVVFNVAELFQLEFGISGEVTGTDEMQVKIGTWYSF